MDEQSEHRLELRRNFQDFLDADYGQGEYLDRIKTLLTKENVSKNRLRLEVDIHDLKKSNHPELYTALLRDPGECIQPFEDAVDELARNSFGKLLPVSSLLETPYQVLTTLGGL